MNIYQLKISLKGSKPPIWCRIQVYSDITFYQLHRIIQIAMEWDDYHLHQFECNVSEAKWQEAEAVVSKNYDHLFNGFPLSFPSELALHQKAYIGDPDQFDDYLLGHLFFDENEEKLSDWLEKEKDKCSYTYDLGDNWKHEILLEKILPVDPAVRYPLCLKAKREAPMEDNGGIWNVEEEDEAGGRTEWKIVETINELFRNNEEQLNPKGSNHLNSSEPDGNEVSLEEWNQLYQAAIRFKELKSWQWMSNDDLFAVQDSQSGHTAYCSVMGEAGQLFGLAVYVGDEGLNTLIKVLTDQIRDDELLDQRSLLLTFQDREALDKPDHELIRSLGLRFRGRNQWPLFRSYSPGLYPWYLNKQEVSFMTTVLEQAIDVCQRARENPYLIKGKSEQDIFTRRSILRDQCLDWEDTWLKLVRPSRYDGQQPSLTVNELELQRARAYKTAPIVLEFHFQYFPEPVQDRPGERPYYPYAGLWAEQQSGLILDAELVPRENHAARFQEKLLHLIQRNGWKPKTVLVQKENVYQVLAPVTDKLGINLELVSELPVLDSAMREMFDVLGGPF